jgi:hypothetical protein
LPIKRAAQFEGIPVITQIPTSIPSDVPDIQGAFSTAAAIIPSRVSDIKSVAGAIATAIPEGITQIVPQNCTIGIKQFCIGFNKDIECHNMPVTLSKIIPSEVKDLLRLPFDGVDSFDAALSRITSPFIQYTLIAGLVVVLIITCIFISLLYGWFSLLSCGVNSAALGAVIYLILGLLSCIPFIIPTVSLHAVRSRTEGLPAWIQMQQGDLYGLCIGCILSAITVAIAGSGAMAFL